jgi:hypothetical protein
MYNDYSGNTTLHTAGKDPLIQYRKSTPNEPFVEEFIGIASFYIIFVVILLVMEITLYGRSV